MKICNAAISVLLFVSSLSSAQDVWEAKPTGTDASLRGLCVVSRSVVWVSGTQGTVLRTTDAGSTWTNVSVGSAKELDFRDIHAFNDRQAVVLSAGQPARVYLTNDSGKSWKMTFEHPNEKSFFDALSFWDNKHGIAMSDPVDGRVLLVETNDGGRSWNELSVSRRPQAERGEGGFAASGTNMILVGNRCLIALGSGEDGQVETTSRVLYSDDRCQSWKTAEAPFVRNPSSGIFSLAFSDSKIGIAVGGDYLDPKNRVSNIAVSKDAGTTWSRPKGTPPRGYRSGVASAKLKGKPIWISVGPDGTDISYDDGAHWKAASQTGFHAVAFTTDGKHGWASGSEGRVAKWIAQDKR